MQTAVLSDCVPCVEAYEFLRFDAAIEFDLDDDSCIAFGPSWILSPGQTTVRWGWDDDDNLYEFNGTEWEIVGVTSEEAGSRSIDRFHE